MDLIPGAFEGVKVNPNAKKKSLRKKKAFVEQMDIFDILFTEENKENFKQQYVSAVEETIEEVKKPLSLLFEASSELLDFKLTKQLKLSGTIDEKIERNIKAIQTLNNLKAYGKYATESEQKNLAKYSGWGGLSVAFQKSKYNYRIKNLLSNEDYTSIVNTVNTAFYTPIEVIRFIYAVLERMGFEGGHILDPATGTGHFLGVMPQNIRENSKIVAIEKDSISGTIAQQLYQTADVKINGYEDTYLKDNSFDLIITNVPFVDISVVDKYDKDLNKHNLLLHDYYFAKSLRKVRDGGIIAFITSAGTMDKENTKLRELMSNSCDLLGAIRLPYNAFKSIANVDVMTDIIFLQKTNEPTETSWMNTKGYNGANINEYYVDHPYMMIGELKEISSRFGKKHILEFKGDLDKELTKKISMFPIDVYEALNDDSYRYEEAEIVTIAGTNLERNLKPFSYTKYEGKYYQRQGVHLLPINVKNPQLLDEFITLKNQVKLLIDEQLENCSDEKFVSLQNELADIYDNFKNNYGYINSKGVKKLLSDDPEYFLVASIEKEVTGNTYAKGPFFTTRTIGARQRIEKADSVEDALIYSFGEKGTMDLAYISNLLKRDLIEVREELLQKGLIFYDIDKDDYVHRDEYLSGNVKKKLKLAQDLVAEVPSLNRNIMALEGVQPEYIYDVYYQLGTTWIDENIYNKFVTELLQCDTVSVKYSKALGKFTITVSGYISPIINRTTYGTNRLNAVQIIRHAFNLTNPVIFDEIETSDGKTKKVKNVEATELARSKVDIIRNEFLVWVDKNPEVKDKLITYYNDNFNNIVNRKYHGDFLKPRINPNIKLRDYQKNAVARIIQSNYNTLLAHEVGAGKSFTMMTSIMEMKRLGIICKPMIIIPNSMVESGQFVNEFLTLYPYANVLSATSKDFSKANRRKLINKIATVDWDAIVIGHSSFKMIPLDKEFQSGMINDKISEYDSIIYELDEQEDKIAIKQIQKQIDRLKVRLEKLMLSEVDDGLPTFDKLGIDFIQIDEAHNFKNLGISTRLTGISGVQTSDAQKSFDLHCKIEYLRQKYGKKVVTFATATPISNSICEAYTMMLYLIPEVLEQYGLKEFDSWASTYGKIVSQLEVDVIGQGFKVKDRFAEFCNVPELITMFRETADVMTKDMLNLPIPKLQTGGIINVSVEPSQKIKEYVENLVNRAEAIERKLVSPMDDNMLLITTDGRKVATDPRLVGIEANDYEDTPKLNAVCDNVYKEYVQGAAEKLTQIIFLNLGTPTSKGFNLYNDIRDRLVSMGIPKEQVQFIHEANTPEKRSRMLTEFRNGDFRILIGSTSKLGEGQNLQNRLKCLHEVDCEWKPALITQKEGRCLRVGNLNKEVAIYRYLVKGTFDVYMWQTCETKAKYIDQIMNNKTGARKVEDLGETILSFAETKALACNNPLIMEKFKIDKQVQQLQILEKGFKEQQIIAFRKKKDYEYKKNEYIELREQLKIDVDYAERNWSNDFKITINELNYCERVLAGEKLIEYLDNLKVTYTHELLEKSMKVGEFRGFDIMYKLSKDIDNSGLVKRIGLKHNKFHFIDFSISPLGLITRIENRVKGLTQTISILEEDIDKLKENLIMVDKELTREFNKAIELRDLLEKQRLINTELNVNSGVSQITEVSEETEEAV